MKRLLAILLTMMLVFSMTACNRGEVENPSNGDISDERTDDKPSDIAEPTPPPPPKPPSDITPLMWLVTAPDGQTMYLFGSIHAGTEDIYPLPDTIMDAFNECDYLAVEVDIVAFQRDFAAQVAMGMSMVYDDGRTIADDIDAEILGRARELIEEHNISAGIPVALLDMYRPAMWISLFEMAAVEMAGLDAKHGLDEFFLREAKRQRMTILEVESIEEQVALLIGYSAPLQSMWLEGVLDLELGTEQTMELYEMWKLGDEDDLTKLTKPVYDDSFYEEHIEDFEDYEEFLYFLELMDELNGGLLTQRDIGMADAAMQYMAEGKKVFYVVGLAHLLGEDSVVDLLRKNGYSVERVEIR